jgi:NitT/TauT family transport system substrate-binding protein
MNRKFAATALLAFGLVAGGEASAQAADKVVLLLNWYNYGEHAPFYMGVVRGLYKKHNIEIEIQEGRGSGVTVQAVAAGSATFGYADWGTMVKAASKGAPVTGVGMLLQKNPMSAMGFADKNISKPADLVGKRVISTPGDSFSQLFPAFLKINGVKESQVTKLSGDAATKRTAVINDQADLLLGNINDQLVLIEDQTGRKMRALLFADFGVNTVNAAVIAPTDLTKNKPDLVKRFMTASTEAAEATVKDPAAAVAAMLQINPKAGKTENLTRSLGLSTPLYHTEKTVGQRPFRADMGDIENTLKVMTEYSGLDADAVGKAASFYTNAYLP